MLSGPAPVAESLHHDYFQPSGMCRRLPFAATGVVGGASAPWDMRSSGDRKSTRLNSSHVAISYAVFCLKKKILEIMSDTGEETSLSPLDESYGIRTPNMHRLLRHLV